MRTMTTESGIRTQSLIAVSSTRSSAIVVAHNDSLNKFQSLAFQILICVCFEYIQISNPHPIPRTRPNWKSFGVDFLMDWIEFGWGWVGFLEE